MLSKLRCLIASWMGGSGTLAQPDQRRDPRKSSRQRQAGKPGGGDPTPETLSAAELHARWISGTLAQLGQVAPHRDGRSRVRGAGLLDLCASPHRIHDALVAFQGWLSAMSDAGLQVEIRQLDGWQVCVVAGHTALPVRVRERMRRTDVLRGANRRLEQWLGAKRTQVFTPSGELELQVLRNGVCAGAFPIGANAPEVAYQASIVLIKDLQKLEQAWQSKARASAERRRFHRTPPVLKREMVSGLHNKRSQRGMGTGWPDATTPDLESDLSRLASVLHGLDRTLRQIDPAAFNYLQMRSSLGLLAAACRVAPECSTASDLNRLHGRLEVLEAYQQIEKPFLTSRKRVVV